MGKYTREFREEAVKLVTEGGLSVIEYEFSEHAYDMLRERNIQEDWVKLVIEDPMRKEPKDDGTVHYIRAIEQHEGRFLRVVLNPDVRPQKIVTVFFDRRLRRSQ